MTQPRRYSKRRDAIDVGEAWLAYQASGGQFGRPHMAAVAREFGVTAQTLRKIFVERGFIEGKESNE